MRLRLCAEHRGQGSPRCGARGAGDAWFDPGSAPCYREVVLLDCRPGCRLPAAPGFPLPSVMPPTGDLDRPLGALSGDPFAFGSSMPRASFPHSAGSAVLRYRPSAARRYGPYRPVAAAEAAKAHGRAGAPRRVPRSRLPAAKAALPPKRGDRARYRWGIDRTSETAARRRARRGC